MLTGYSDETGAVEWCIALLSNLKIGSTGQWNRTGWGHPLLRETVGGKRERGVGGGCKTVEIERKRDASLCCSSSDGFPHRSTSAAQLGSRNTHWWELPAVSVISSFTSFHPAVLRWPAKQEPSPSFLRHVWTAGNKIDEWWNLAWHIHLFMIFFFFCSLNTFFNNPFSDRGELLQMILFSDLFIFLNLNTPVFYAPQTCPFYDSIANSVK